MLIYSALFMDKKHGRAEVFSGILTNLPKQKLDIIKLNNLNKNLKQQKNCLLPANFTY